MAQSMSGRNEIFLHEECGIIRMTINGVDIHSVKDYQLKNSANGMTELTVTIQGHSLITGFEASLIETQQQNR